MILGIDEVGRGAWAGPLVVGAVVLGGAQIEGLTDSKKLTPKRRQILAKQIKEQAAAIGLGWVSAETIDRIGLSEALNMAARLAVKDIDVKFDEIIIDGNINLLQDSRVTTLKKADLLIPSVSAASIVAKVARDYYMSEIVSKEYPEYSFEKHVGYGTAAHSEALKLHGANELHRLSFVPVKKALGMEISKVKIDKISSTTGRIAEDTAATYLRQKGFEIIEQNWRTKLCEIDIVAQKNKEVYLIEVKYRKNAKHGGGMSAVTPKKLRQMRFAGRVWQHWKGFEGNIHIGAVSVSNEPPKVDDFIQSIQ